MEMQAGVILKVRRAFYILSAIPALVCVVTGKLGENDDRMLVAVATPYFLWLFLFGAFVWLSFLEVTKTSRFVVTCIYHLSCVGVILFFFSSLHTGDSNALFLWIPIGTHVGILAAVGLQECASMISWRKIRGLLLSFLEGLRVLMGAEEVQLPRYERGRQSPPRYGLTNTSVGPEWHVFQNLPSSTPTLLAAYQRADVMPNDESEANPWR
ncbi:hypothetical protein E8E14_010048 [Neopestalotiopsis sp. 37M]|nr:hypothetical protein E8E14_010048 [Neopestalotiopsis sp. 37M]